jgi:hypothetical protein
VSNIITNEEFLFLVEGRSPRLKQIAKVRHENDLTGSLTEKDVDAISFSCYSSGCTDDVEWLKSLKIFSRNGTIDRIKTGNTTWNEHVAEVHVMKGQQKIPYAIKEMVIVKDSGKKGMVADYNVEKGEYIILLTPFQVVCLKPDQLLTSWKA